MGRKCTTYIQERESCWDARSSSATAVVDRAVQQQHGRGSDAKSLIGRRRDGELSTRPSNSDLRASGRSRPPKTKGCGGIHNVAIQIMPRAWDELDLAVTTVRSASERTLLIARTNRISDSAPQATGLHRSRVDSTAGNKEDAISIGTETVTRNVAAPG